MVKTALHVELTLTHGALGINED